MKFVRHSTLLLVCLLTLAGCSMRENESQRDAAAATDSTADTDAIRTPVFIREHGNHLVNEPSLYLQQHAHNPIDWYPWGDAALDRAKREDKPIFLSVGYASCHWCHVMEHEVFEHDDVAEFMNTHFICIKVDREERPDLDAVYMDAVQMLTGRGGWPMSVWLTPDLKPFHGGTYFPKDHFLRLVQQIVEIYSQRRGELDKQAGELASRIAADPVRDDLASGSVTSGTLATAVQQAKQVYDQTHGGFNQSQKFPTPVKWRFLLHEFRRTGDPELGEMIRATCRAMAGGGIYDHVGGGFHRYTVDPEWTVPHFEKMLYDNGQLAGLFLEAGIVFDDPALTATGTDVLDFLLRDMSDEAGGLHASYDADSGGEEGTYYIWSAQDITAAVGADDGPALADLLGVTDEGNFEHTGKSVLTLRADAGKIARDHDREEADLHDLFLRHRGILREVRDRRTPPGRDRKIITSWNGLAMASLAQGFAATGDDAYLAGAEQIAGFLLDQHRRADGRLWRSSSDGRTAGNGILDDYAFLADGLLELYQVSGQTRWLAAARELIDLARSYFARNGGGYYLTPDGGEAPLGRTVEYHDSVIPSGNAVMLLAQIKLAALTGETAYRDSAREGLSAWAGILERAGLEMAGWLDGAAKTLVPFHEVVIAGDPHRADTRELKQALLGQMPPNAVVSLVPATGGGADLLALAPSLQGKTALSGHATAYVCEFGVCQKPTTAVAEMLEQLDLD